jgi:WD40 repeat protein
MIVQHQYHVFLSHNSADKAAVELIARRLREEADLEPFLDSWHLVPGDPWQEGLERALDASGTCAVFLGPAGLGTWDNEAMRVALDIRAENPDFRVVPALLPGAVLPERGRLPRFLARLKWVDFRAGLDDAQAFHELVSGILGVAPGPSDLPDSAVVCPFRGLEVFEEEHAEFFFGREALTQHLVEQLRIDRFLAVVGPSGSGKSSLVRAGLVPQVRQGTLSNSQVWPVVLLKPGPHPLDTLASRLLPLLGSAADPLAARQTLLDTLTRDERGLHVTVQTALASMGDSRRMLLVIDQFEELFTLCRDDAERHRFIATLLYASAIPGGQTIAVITMRADFLGKCAAYADLAARLKGLELVGPMDVADLRRAMLGPAEKVGLRYEKGLVESILEDLGDEPGGLPLLQHTLLELWERRRGGWLTTDAYQTIGGVRGALAQRADAVYDRLPSVQQAAARRVLLRLTQPGEGTEDTRRRAPLSELLPAHDGAADVEAAVRALTDARLLITSTDEPGAEIVDVAHEALIRGWPRLQGWIDENRAALRTHRRLTEAANEWATNTRDASFLYRGARLAEAQEWATAHADDLNELEQQFLEASVTTREAERRAAQRRVRQVIGGLVSALVVISVVAGFALWFWRASEEATALAQQQTLRVEQAALLNRARLLFERGRSEFDSRPLLGLRLAIEGLVTAPPDATDVRAVMGQTISEMAAQGRILRLTGDVAGLYYSPDSKVLILDRSAASAELRRTFDGALISKLPGNITVDSIGAVPGDSYQKGTGDTERVYYSQDGRFVVLDYDDAAAEVRQTEDGALVSTLTHKVVAANFSPDGRAVMLTYEDGASELRRTDNGAIIPLAGKIRSVAFSPRGAVFLVSYEDTTSELRRTEDGALIRQLPGRLAVAYDAVTFGPDEGIVVIKYENAPQELRRTDTGAVIPLPETPQQLIFDPQGSVLIVGYQDAEDELRRANDGALMTKLSGHVADIAPVAFSPDGNAFVVSYQNAPGELRRTDNGAVVQFTHMIRQVTFNTTRTRFVVTYADAPGELRRTDTGALVAVLTSQNDFIDSPFSPDGTVFVASYENAPGELRRTDDGKIITTFEKKIISVAFSPDGRVFVLNYYDGPGELRRAVNGALIARLRGGVGNGYTYFSRDGTIFVEDYDAAPVEMHRTDNGALLSEMEGYVTDITFSTEQTVFIVNYTNGRRELWDGQGMPRRLADLSLGGDKFVFAPGEQRLVVRYVTGQVYLLDIAWLQSMSARAATPAIDELIRLACTGPLASEVWSTADQVELQQALGDKKAQSCN